MVAQSENNFDEEIARHLSLVGHSGGSYSTRAHHNRLQALGSAPIISSKIKNQPWPLDNAKSIFPAYGHLGIRSASYAGEVETTEHQFQDNLLYANVNAPWSAFICGSQGAGKSHTLSCLLENALLSDGFLGPNPKPLSGMVFHYDKYASEGSGQICEAAFLASKGIEVEVFVVPENWWVLKENYTLPGIPADKQPIVRPLFLHDSQINRNNMRALMNLDEKDGKTPLYMAIVNKILRDLSMESKGAGGLNYDKFQSKIKKAKLNPTQHDHLEQRLELLESFLLRFARPELKKVAGEGFTPKAGSMTIIDLSCDTIGEGDACMLFSIFLTLFLRSRGNHGLIIALDEAHKVSICFTSWFFTNRKFIVSHGNQRRQTFSEQIIRVIREQRHSGSRVIVATQEPTLSPALLDLCNVTIVHRFQSQAWYATLKSHLAALSTPDENNDVFKRIVDLENGEALLFCPTAYLDADDSDELTDLKPLRSGYIKMRVRKRITEDGGKSVMAVEMETKAKGGTPMTPKTKMSKSKHTSATEDWDF